MCTPHCVDGRPGQRPVAQGAWHTTARNRPRRAEVKDTHSFRYYAYELQGRLLHDTPHWYSIASMKLGWQRTTGQT